MQDKNMTDWARAPRKKGRPVAVVKHGSTAVPIYRGAVRGCTRFTVAFYLNGRRERRTFGSLDDAKEEARKAALNIQRGMSHDNEMRPQDRESFRAAQSMLAELGVPLLTAVDEYVRCRRKLGDTSLTTSVDDYARRTQSYTAGMTVPQVVDALIASKTQDRMSNLYVRMIKGVLEKFSAAFPGDISQVTSPQIDAWLRRGEQSMVTRNNWLKRVKVLFSYARQRGYLPKREPTAAESLKRGKERDTDVGIFTPEQMEQLLRAAPLNFIPVLAIGGFAGLRGAEIGRLDWKAVDLTRKIIELRAGQAKTASRRIIPITDNLAAWLLRVEREGPVVPNPQVFVQITALARKLGVGWPHNVLRHSYISYRIAIVQNAAQVALEAGNSPTIIFKHYRELVTKDEADKWFGIMPLST
ncbi:MAG: hypothetical protein WCN98_09760 [Verrucomicrobiaceae bacterium]